MSLGVSDSSHHGMVRRERPVLFFDARHAEGLRERAGHPRTASYCRAMLEAAEQDVAGVHAGAKWVEEAQITGGPSYVEMAVAHDGRERLIRLGLAYLVTLDRRFAQAGADLMRAAMRRDWDTFLMADLVMAAWVHGLLAAQDWLESSGALGADDDPEGLAARTRATAIETAGWLAHDLIKGGNPLRRNHDVIEACTIGLVALAYPDHREASRWLALALKTLDDLFAALVGEDGDWYEKTPRYQCYLFHWFVPFADACRAAGVRDFYPISVVRRLFDCLLQWIAPNGWNIGFNDVNHDEMVKMAPWLLAKAASEYREGAFLWALDRVQKGAPNIPSPHHEVFLHLDPERAPAPTEPRSEMTTHLRRSGVILARTGWGAKDSLFALQCGPYTSHDHLDKSTFELYYRGVPLVLDTGCGHYPDRGHYLPSSMHNIVVVDGGYQLRLVHRLYGSTGFDFCPPFHGQVISVLSGAQLTCVEADHSRHAQIQSARRIALFAHPGYVILLDELDDDRAHRFDSYIHVRGQAEAQSSSRVVRWTVPEGIKLALHVIVPEQAEISLGDHPLALQSAADMLIEYKEHLWRRRNASLTYARVSGHGASVRFLQVLVPRAPGDPEVTVRQVAIQGGEALLLIAEDVEDLWISQPSGHYCEMEDVETDARVAFVRVRRGEPVVWLVLDGCMLAWRGRPLVRSPVKTRFLGQQPGHPG